MNSYGKIYDESIGNYGLITSARASELGISNMTLVLLAQRGRLLHIRRGLYRLAHYVPTEYDGFAQAVMTVGENAYLYGESVIKSCVTRQLTLCKSTWCANVSLPTASANHGRLTSKMEMAGKNSMSPRNTTSPSSRPLTKPLSGRTTSSAASPLRSSTLMVSRHLGGSLGKRASCPFHWDK